MPGWLIAWAGWLGFNDPEAELSGVEHPDLSGCPRTYKHADCLVAGRQAGQGRTGLGLNFLAVERGGRKGKKNTRRD